nr:Chain C, Calpastatin [Sus scrofa]1NX0_D Chain D, Calpastatin [Sus scrofa]
DAIDALSSDFTS